MNGCKAEQYGGQMVCGACNLVWNMNDTDPPKCNPTEEVEGELNEAFKGWIAMNNAPTHKMDHGKPNMSIMLDAPKSMADFAKIMEHGGKKDGRTLTSWKDYDDARGLESALLRHLMAWHNGAKTDEESGMSHLSHVVANAIILRETEKSRHSSGE